MAQVCYKANRDVCHTAAILGHSNKMFSFCSVASRTVMRAGGLLLLLLQNV